MRFTLRLWPNFASAIYLTEYIENTFQQMLSRLRTTNYAICALIWLDRLDASNFNLHSESLAKIVGADEEDASRYGTKYSLACVGVDSMLIKSVND